MIKNILVTAGPTREKIDPVRYISNYSTGKIGYEIASAAKSRGLSVILVSGPTRLAAPEGVKLVSVESADDMRKAVLKF
ncbi:MAG: phosphopantothenoylcysteine decarboxylase, partial [Candidatus Omnitrophota bacterium]